MEDPHTQKNYLSCQLKFWSCVKQQLTKQNFQNFSTVGNFWNIWNIFRQTRETPGIRPVKSVTNLENLIWKDYIFKSIKSAL